MNCFSHPQTLATVRCSSCDRGLCPRCDHRIKGFPYCQDCIVAGIESLRRNSGESARARQDEKSPLIAVLMGLIPGLGAAYNGQNVKALVHFTIILGLSMLADIFNNPLEVVFGLGVAGTYIFSIYDAYRSARHQRSGEDLQAEDDRLKLCLRENTRLWGGLLLGIGVLSILNLTIPDILQRFWPFLLILAGLFLLRGFSRGRNEPSARTIYRTPPPSVIPPSFDKSTGEFAHADRTRNDSYIGN
ncbi:MAG: hypothetical protein IPM55_01890 [Acidobacteria bacterium]|nr:hypothetical protein [Acidobacteriota bacterium]